MSKLAWRSPADLLGGLAPPISVASFARDGENAHPHYQLIAIGDDSAWMRDVQSGTDHVLPKARSQNI